MDFLPYSKQRHRCATGNLVLVEFILHHCLSFVDSPVTDLGCKEVVHEPRLKA